MAITHYEVCVVKLGRWALHARLSQGEQSQALEVARSLEAETGRATQTLEERLEPEAERLTTRVIGQFDQAPTDVKGPSTGTDITSRVVMVGLNAFGIGAIVTVLMAMLLWSFRDTGAAPGNAFNMLLMFTFAATALTAWALAAAVKQSRQWSDKGINVKIAVKLSAHDLGNRHLPSEIANLLTAYDVSPGRIILEITESAIMENQVQAQEVLKTLSGMGLTPSIDDYGIGHSSLAYLKSLPVQEIKIDKSFVLKLSDSRGDQILVKSTIELGHNLGLRVTAEGVEDRASLDILQNLACDTGQGYFISRPMSVEDFEIFFTTSRWSPHFGGRGITGVVAATGG